MTKHGITAKHDKIQIAIRTYEFIRLVEFGQGGCPRPVLSSGGWDIYIGEDYAGAAIMRASLRSRDKE